MKDKVLILGAGGFVGLALTRALSAAGISLIAVGRHPELAKMVGIRHIDENFTSPEQFALQLPECRAVVHLASASTPGGSAGRPMVELESNLRTTFALLHALQETPDCHLLYLSSGGTLYGDADNGPVGEGHLIQPKSYYGAGKAAAEHFITAWTMQYAAGATILRPSNLYGPGQTTRQGFGIIPTAFDAIRHGTPVTVWGDGNTIRDYLFIDDFIDLCRRILAAPAPTGTRVLNAASGSGISLNTLLDHIEDVAGRPIERRYHSGRAVDVLRIVLDAERARQHYGWAARTAIRRGLELTWQWQSRQP